MEAGHRPLNQNLAALTDEQLQKQVAPGRNHLFYLLGFPHLSSTMHMGSSDLSGRISRIE
jgi:hypothetical protein